MIPLEVREHNGDKYAYFLALFQEELGDKFVARYGNQFRSILIFDRETVYPLWQGRLPHSFRKFLKEDNIQITVVIHIPKVYLATRDKEYIIIKIKKIKPYLTKDIDGIGPEIQSGQKLCIWNGKEFEIYEYAQWQKVGIRYRSER